jgi:cob(I)alamin adenosyltransferase
MKIYTRTGDKGETGLFGGKRVSKASLRIEAYGTADELNAALGMAATQISSPEIKQMLERLQNELHIVCADLANPDLHREVPRIRAAHVEALEKLCDQLDEKLPPLQKFILPSGSFAGATLHYARTVARRAERRTVELAAHEEVNPETVRYLNRLSDLLFLMARTVNQQAGAPEIHPDYTSPKGA